MRLRWLETRTQRTVTRAQYPDHLGSPVWNIDETEVTRVLQYEVTDGEGNTAWVDVPTTVVERDERKSTGAGWLPPALQELVDRQKTGTTLEPPKA